MNEKVKHLKPMKRTHVDYKKLLKEEEKLREIQMQINGLKMEVERINNVMNILYKEINEKLRRAKDEKEI